MAASPPWASEDFRNGARKLIDVLKKVYLPNHLMEWELNSDSAEDYMLVHPPLTRASSISITKDDDETDTVDEQNLIETTLDADPDTYRVSKAMQTQTIWRFSIVYSHTWRVPVLYFDVENQDGSPCSRSSVVDMLTQMHHQNDTQDSWDFVSYEEHPLTGHPSFFLHPCRTRDRMHRIKASTATPALRLLIWMSMILPSVGYSIPATAFERVKEELNINDK